MRLTILTAFALLGLAACSSGGGGTDKSPDQLKAELPAPYNTGDFGAGKQAFAQCAACHTVVKGGADGVGPNLFGVFGSVAGMRRDQFGYSDALKKAGWTWDAPQIDKWIADPLTMLPGTKMAFVGIKDAKQRNDLIVYLKVATSGGPS